MKRLMALCFLLCLAVLVGPALAQNKAATSAFAKLKALVGEWEGRDSEGNALTMSYELVAGNTTVIEKIHDVHNENMVTLYHMDGNALLATHYCSIGNQPRMRAVVSAGEIKQLQFNFAGATNLANPSAGHMRNLTINFIDQDHYTQVWTYRDNGKDSSSTFTLARKK